MPRDGDVALVRKPERDERTARALRAASARDEREEALEDDALHLVAREVRAMRAPPTRRAPDAATATDTWPGRRRAEQRLLGGAARGDELREARRVELVAVVSQPGLEGVREREVHVVAAEQQVRAHRDARHALGPPATRTSDRSVVPPPTSTTSTSAFPAVSSRERVAPARRAGRAIQS